MKVLYYIRPHFVAIFPEIAKNIGELYIQMVGTSNQSVPEMAIDLMGYHLYHQKKIISKLGYLLHL